MSLKSIGNIGKKALSLITAIVMVILSPSLSSSAYEDDVIQFDDPYFGVTSFIDFDSNYKVVYVGESIKLRTILYGGLSGVGAVDYISSDESILTVDSDGMVLPLKSGECTVTAVAKGSGNEAVCTIKVIDKAERVITLSQESLSLQVNSEYKLNATCNDNTASLIWISSDANVATVNSDGLVTAVSEGTADITVADDSLSARANCKVTVYSENNLEIYVESKVLYTGNHLKVIVDTPVQTGISYESSNEEVASVDSNGIVKGLKAGKTVITVLCSDDNKSASVELTVKTAPDDNITLTTDTLEIRNGQSFYMKAKTYSGNVIWGSSDESIVTVKNGIVTGKKRGIAILSAKSDDGKYVATSLVNVKGKAPIKFIYTNPNSAPLNTPVTLYAITDKLRDNVRFTVDENDNKTTIDATDRQEDGDTYIWSATYTFKTSGFHEVSASALYNGTEWASGEFSKTMAFVTKSNDLTKCTLEERRVSNKLINLLASFEGYSSSYYEDKLANNILTMGYGKVIYEGNYFFDNITKAEAMAYLINDTNDGAYTFRVNDFLLQNSIEFNQNQFDSLVCFSYNLGTGWITKSDLSTLIKTESIDKDIVIEHKAGDKLYVNVADSLNLRSGPGTDHSIIGVLHDGDALTLLDGKLYNENWYYVETEEGKKGYCHKNYLVFADGQAKGSLLNIKPDDLVYEMLQWHKAGGKCIAGLLYRRIDELEVFLYAEYTQDGSRNKHGFKLPDCF